MSSQQLIANELLAFIQYAIDTMDEVSILQICKSNFKEEEISSAKKLLYQTLGKINEMPPRRRDGTEKSVQDIITLLKVTDPDDVPAFVAKELHKLPPVTFDHVDVTSLLKDIVFLKSSLAEVQTKLETSNRNVKELRDEIMLLRSAVPECRLFDASKVNTKRGAQNASVGSFCSANRASPTVDIAVIDSALRPAAVSADPAPIAHPAHAPRSRISTSTPKRDYATVAAKQSRRCISTQKQHQHAPLDQQRDKEGFITVEKRKKKPTSKNQCGRAPTGPNHLLRPAVPTTPLYVSRLMYSTTAEEIVEYIRVKTKFTLRVIRLESRHSVNFNSFVLRVPTENIAIFTKEEFWPAGVVFRRFRGRLPDTARHTAPLTSVK